MTSTLSQRSIHIDAPVQRVFDHIKDPNNVIAAEPEPVHLSNLSLTPVGVGSVWESSWRAFGPAITTKLPPANTVLNRFFRSQGRQLDTMLVNYQQAIQA